MKKLVILLSGEHELANLSDELKRVLEKNEVILVGDDGIYNTDKEKILDGGFACLGINFEEGMDLKHGHIEVNDNWKYLGGFVCPFCHKETEHITIVKSGWERNSLTLSSGEIYQDDGEYNFYEYFCPYCETMLPHKLGNFLENISFKY